MGRGKHDKAEANAEGGTNFPGNSEAALENALASGQGNKYGIYKHLEKEGDTVNASGEIVAAAPGSGTLNQAAAAGQSDFTHYYHPDHLGSTGYVTDANGKLYEHLEYFPFGETWVQEHSNTLRTPYLFTGKEFDQETGLYYFGARYYDPRTSVWQSGDPILGKYLPTGDKEKDSKLPGMGGVYKSLNLGLYTYAHQNPLIFIDPDGNLTVHIWDFQGKSEGWGHASITLDDGTHISWWPNKNAGMQSSKDGSNIYSAPAYKNQLLKTDIKWEGRKPDHEIKIKGLDEKAIKAWWLDFKNHNEWKTLSQNCSTTASDALKVGGGGKYMGLSNDGASQYNLIWTPDNVKKFAEQINIGMERNKTFNVVKNPLESQ